MFCSFLDLPNQATRLSLPMAMHKEIDQPDCKYTFVSMMDSENDSFRNFKPFHRFELFLTYGCNMRNPESRNNRIDLLAIQQKSLDRALVLQAVEKFNVSS